MGQHGGPLNKAIGNLSLAIDASNIRSYSGTGNTLSDLVSSTSATLSSVTYSSSGSLGYYVFSGTGNISSSSNCGISGANSRTISCWAYFTSKAIQSLLCIGVNGAGTGWGIETSSTVFNLSKGNFPTFGASKTGTFVSTLKNYNLPPFIL